MPTVLKRMMTFILLLPLLLALSLDVKAQRSRRPEPKPLSDDEKVQVVGDLVGWEPFFQAWGVPVSDSAREAVADLPGWMPVDLPATSSPGE